ncbi:hypothetical protein Trydic_g3377 [Trypoxylus dichotomus]
MLPEHAYAIADGAEQTVRSIGTEHVAKKNNLDANVEPEIDPDRQEGQLAEEISFEALAPIPSIPGSTRISARQKHDKFQPKQRKAAAAQKNKISKKPGRLPLSKKEKQKR